MVPWSGLVPSDRRSEVLVAGLLAAVVLGGVAFAGSLVVAAMTATGALGTGVSLWLLLALLLTVLATGVVAAGATAGLAWLALEELRTAIVSGWRRFLWVGYRRARAVEEHSHLGRALRPSRLFEARGDREGHLVEELKTRYVAGEVDEADFERELRRLLGGDDGEQVRREIDVTAADGDAGPSSSRATSGGSRARSATSEADASASKPRTDDDRRDREPESEAE